MRVELFRLEHTTAHTISTMRVDGVSFCSTLEPAWRDNTPFVSCIPCGIYKVKRFISQLYGATWRVVDVPGRTHILFHPGNWASNTEGCILLGQYPGKLRGERSVDNSGATFEKFMLCTQAVDSFDLFIVSV